MEQPIFLEHIAWEWESRGGKNASGLLPLDPHQGELSACFIEVIQL